MSNGYHTPEIPDNMELDCTQTNGDADWRRTGRTNSCYGSDSVDQEHFWEFLSSQLGFFFNKSVKLQLIRIIKSIKTLHFLIRWIIRIIFTDWIHSQSGRIFYHSCKWFRKCLMSFLLFSFPPIIAKVLKLRLTFWLSKVTFWSLLITNYIPNICWDKKKKG